MLAFSRCGALEDHGFGDRTAGLVEEAGVGVGSVVCAVTVRLPPFLRDQFKARPAQLFPSPAELDCWVQLRKGWPIPERLAVSLRPAEATAPGLRLARLLHSTRQSALFQVADEPATLVDPPLT